MRKILLFSIFGLFTMQAISQSIPEYCLENDVVHKYLTEVQYDPDNYNYSKIMDYCYSYPWDWDGEGKGVRLDFPKPVNLKLASALETDAKLSVSETDDYSDAETLVMNVAKGSTEINVYNLIPGRIYNWKLVDSNGAEITSGKFKTTGTLRMLKIDNIFNVRDMGGWTGLGGKPLKYGKIIRGSRLNVNGSTTLLLTDDGIKEMRRVGLRAELDMRDASNSVNARHAFFGDDCPILNVNQGYKSRIATFAEGPQSIQGINQLISWLKQGKPVYLHCSVGADRTGTVAFLVGALCGMSEDALSKEFELTSFSGDKIENEADRGNYERLVRQRDYTGRLDPNDNNESYKYAKMIDIIKTYPGATLQRKVYNHLRTGVSGVRVTEADLAFLVKEMTDYTIISDVECNVDTLRLEGGETFQIKVKAIPEEAEIEQIKFKTSSSQIATIDEEGNVTAVSGGKALITVDVDGILKMIPVIIPITKESVPNICLENELVHKYMTEVKYDANDYTVSYIDKYDTVTTSYDKDWPNPAKIEWNIDPDAVSQYLIVAKDSAFDKVTFETETNVKSGYWDVKHLDPQKFYYFTLSSTYGDKSTTEVLSSAFLTTGTVKMIRADGTYNVRDFGGWTGLDGRRVKYGKLVRGARLKNNKDNTENSGMVMINSDGIEALYKKMGINAEIDLRSDEETENSKSALNARSAKFLRIADANTCLGDKILEGDAYIKALNQIIVWFKIGRNVYVSSSLGADRAGTVAFLVNGLLGVDEESLSKDYELSSFSEDVLENVIRKRTDSQYVGMVNKIKTLEGETLQKKIYNYFKTGVNGTTVSAEDLDWFIDVMLEKNSSPVTGVAVVEQDRTLSNGRIYNLLGQEVLNPGKGIYIMNGKKFIVK